jgi:NAD(P)H-hydrate epimerase
MWKVVTVAEMQAVEREADATGLSYAAMMQNAGTNLAEIVHARMGGRALHPRVLALVGPGNNGGDALVALAALAEWGWQVTAVLLRPRPADPLVTRVQALGGELIQYPDDPAYRGLYSGLEQAQVVLDGVLGTGTRLPLRDEPASLLRLVGEFIATQAARPYLVAVDCPSGVDCDSGECAPETLAVDLTVTMAAVKQGLLKFPAAGLVGELHLANIGTLEPLESWKRLQVSLVDQAWVRTHLPARPLNAHKGTFGTALVCAGSLNYSGAAWLAGQAAYRVGAGLVTLAVPEPLHTALAGVFPEATWLLLPHERGFLAAAGAHLLLEQSGRATALLLGPGWGQQACTRDFLEAVLERDLPPVVIDADGLKLLASLPGWAARLRSPAVLTPHPGEMAILTGDPKEAQEDRIAYARLFAQHWGQVVVLKGAYTVVAAPSGEAGVIPFATPALARAGTGDVLAGIITGLVAQGLPAYQAALCGAWLHGRAGVLAAQQQGKNTASVLAGDVLAAVSLALPPG